MKAPLDRWRGSNPHSQEPWEVSESNSPPSTQGKSHHPQHTTGLPSESPGEEIWLNPKLHRRESTANLDDQQPVTLYYLGRLIKFDELVEVYVDQKLNGEIKHWAVIESRDPEVMDRIYEVELETKEKFPYADIDFRVTVHTDEGPSAADQSMKIYEAQ